MQKIGIIYGSSTGKTEYAADRIQEALGQGEVHPIAQVSAEQLSDYDVLILGTSTWGNGELQDDWKDHLDALRRANLTGKTVAFFGLGDQESFSETFVDGLGELYSEVMAQTVTAIGAWPTDGYFFEASRALVKGSFVGLVLDDDNQGYMTDDRIIRWVSALKPILL